jgi:hypothetical protein
MGCSRGYAVRQRQGLVFGGMTIGRINDPLRTADSVLLVASREDLLATKLKASTGPKRRTTATSRRCWRMAVRSKQDWAVSSPCSGRTLLFH